MAGIRISAVTAVGFMTIAAFIGAGGLGFLVFSGIRLIDNAQILAGAIPACILALTVDFLAATVEKMVTPVSLQKDFKNTNKKNQKIILGIFALIVAFLLGFTTAKSVGKASALIVAFLLGFTTAKSVGKARNKTITIGSKDFTEQLIVGHLMADIIEGNTDIKVNRKMALGGGQICFSAIQKGEIDLYMEYSGVAYVNYFNYQATNDLGKISTTLQKDFKEKYDIDTFKEMSFNNTYTLSVTPETAKKYNLKTISDLVKVAPSLKSGTSFEFINREDGLVGLEKVYSVTPETAKKYNLKTISDLVKVAPSLKSGTSFEFINREDGLVGLEKVYGLKMKEKVAIDGSPKYIALLNKDVDVIDAFSTDGLLKKFDLKTLEDDKKFFPPYNGIPLMRGKALEKYPEVKPLIEKLGDGLLKKFDLKTLEDDKKFFPPYNGIPLMRGKALEKYPEVKPLIEKLGEVLTNEEMMELNYKVDEEGKQPEDVAREFLIEKGLIK